MKKIDLNHLRWIFYNYLTSLGFWGLLGSVLLVCSLIIYLTKIIVLDEQIMMAKTKLNQTNSNSIKLLPQPSIQIQTSAQDVAKFYRFFPAGASLPEHLGMINDAAIKYHLVLNRGDYKFTQTKQGQLSRYEIVFPIVGHYIQIRHFIAEVLLKVPALALNDLQIKRENSLSPTVEAKLVFVLFLQGDSW